MNALVLLIFAIVPLSPVATDSFDVVHHNRHYGEDGTLTIAQVWWEAWRDGRHNIEAWRIAHYGYITASVVPEYDHRRRKWVSIWIDGGRLRVVRGTSFAESWTQGADPEIVDRARHEDWRRARRGLSP